MTATLLQSTVKGGFWEVNGVSTLTGVQSKTAMRRRISEMLGKKSLLATREKMFVLMGAAAGSAVSKTLTRVEANSELGGKRNIETETLYSANSDAADITEIKADFLRETAQTTFGASPPANLDGNPLGTR